MKKKTISTSTKTRTKREGLLACSRCQLQHNRTERNNVGSGMGWWEVYKVSVSPEEEEEEKKGRRMYYRREGGARRETSSVEDERVRRVEVRVERVEVTPVIHNLASSTLTPQASPALFPHRVHIIG